MLKEFHIDNPSAWDAVVKSFPDYDIFYLSGYAKAFMQESPENGTPILLLYENGEDRAVNAVFKRDVAMDRKLTEKVEKARFYDLITPYGYGGFWGSVSDWNRMNRTYREYCTANGYVCEFVRFELFTDYYRHYDGEVEARSQNVVRTLDMPLDAIWMDFKQKVRKNVKRANHLGLEIIIEPTDAHLEDYLRIYYSTMDRRNAQEDYYFSKRFYESIGEMKDNIMFFYAVYKGSVISAELVLYGTENCYSFLGGTDREYYEARPNDFLKYEIIKWAKQKGLKRFVLGGGYESGDGIFQYKSNFAPHGIRDFHIGRNIFDRDAYQYLLAQREGDTVNEKFFPLYRG